MDSGALGRVFAPGETILRQGEEGNCMFVIQTGQVEVVKESEGREIPLAVLKEKDFFGEMAIFENAKRNATVRAISEVRVITIDRRNLLSRIQEDPTLAFRLIEGISSKLRELDNLLTIRVKADDLIGDAQHSP